MCVGAVAAVTRDDRGGHIRLRGLSEPGAPFPKDDMIRELHVVDEVGTVYRGYDAVVALIVRHSRLRVLARVLGSRLLRPLGVRAYRFVARQRRRSGGRD
jgi:predicted DCC family thiol-disulfide oxidoreductase YuxK